jgi:hypothetical protein
LPESRKKLKGGLKSRCPVNGCGMETSVVKDYQELLARLSDAFLGNIQIVRRDNEQ